MTNIFYNNCEEFDWMTSYDPFFKVFKIKKYILNNVDAYGNGLYTLTSSSILNGSCDFYHCGISDIGLSLI